MKSDKEQNLIELLEADTRSHGFELVDVEIVGGKHSGTIRVYIDKEDGLAIDNIVEANKWIGDVVEANEPFAGSYTLEVSSPGIDRPLRTREHFIRYCGEEARLTTEKLNGRANWTGILCGVEDEDVVLDIEGEAHRIPITKIKKAHLKGRI